MTLVSSQIPTFSGGVSQQPASQRLSSQLEEQINGFSSPAKGLQKRPPCEHIAKIHDVPVDDAYLHVINRDETERYLVILLAGDLKVFDLSGREITVNFPEGKEYLTAASCRDNFSALTVSDYTFLVNKTKKVDLADEKSPERPYEALINVKLGNYGKTYSIKLNGAVAASYTTPDGTVASHSTAISTDNIAANLYNALSSTKQQTIELTGSGNVFALPDGYINTQILNIQYSYSERFCNSGRNEYYWESSGWVDASYSWQSLNTFYLNFTASSSLRLEGVRVVVTGVGGGLYTVTRYGSVIYIKSGQDFTISTEDGYNNTAMIAIKGKTQKIADLPNRPGVDGFKVCVVGEAGSEDDDYWVSFDLSGSATGVWVEDVAPGIPLRPEPSTMPHALIREADGTFTFRSLEWDDRYAGDEDSNPNPSFVGTTINGMVFFRNRLGILAEDSLILSSAGNYFNFWRTSVKSLLDDDPIDVAASHTKVAFLYHAVPYNQQLFLFSEQSQFVVQEAEILSARTTSIKRTTDYPCSTRVVPASTGKNVYFVADRGEASAVREFYTNTDTGEDATDVTAHVPSYIPKGCFKIAQSPTEDVLVFLTDSKQNSLYPYSYYWNGAQKLQSAWSRWELPESDRILYCEFINSILYLAISRPDGVYLEGMRLSLDGKRPDEPYSVMLDRKVLATALASEDGETTPLDVPYPDDGCVYYAVSKPESGSFGGKIWPVFWNGENFCVDAVLPEGTQYWFGRQYTYQVELSTIFLSSQGQSGTRSYTDGRLTIRNISVNFTDTGFFKVKVTPEGRDEQVKTYTGKTLGTTAQIGTQRITTGSFRVPVMTKNLNTKILIENDSPLPVSLISADWEGDYVTRSRNF